MHYSTCEASRLGWCASAAAYLLTVGSMLCAGCGRQHAEHRFRIFTENGYKVAVTSGTPLYDYPPFRLEEVLRVQQDDSVPASLLIDPHRFGPGPDGTLIVTERIEGRAVVYDSHGRFLRQIGSQGSGPGQFQRIANMQVVGDSLVFYDSGLRRISIFDIDGRLLDTRSTNDFGRQRIVQLLPDGILAIFATPPPSDSTSISVRICDPVTGGTLATFWSGSVEYIPDSGINGRVIGSAPIPFTGAPFAAVVPGSRIIAFSGVEPEIRILDTSGNLIHLVRLELPGRPVTQQMIDEYWEEDDRRLALMGEEPLDERAKAKRVFADKAGWWSGATMDDHGFLWVQDAIYGPFRYEPRNYFVFDPDGRYIGNMELPSRSRFYFHGTKIRGGYLYALAGDPEYGMNVPIVYRIIPNSDEVRYP